MNILIVEDEKLAVRKLTRLLEEVAPHVVIKGVTPSIEATVTWIDENRGKNEKEPDLIFLDIELADGQSFEIFNRTEIRSMVIFTTSYDEYALQAFKVNSIDYLLKPVQKEDLQRGLKKYEDLVGYKQRGNVTVVPEGLENILKNLRLQQPAKEYRKRFLVKQGARMISVEVGDIAFFYTEESISFFKNYQGQKFVLDYRMDELEGFLDPEHFFRVNRGMIVTHQAVTQIQPYYNHRLALALQPAFEKEVIVSREKTGDFKKWMGK
ncbi:Transcriptional regulatory protein YpdB [Dyadobacter sp. CECT 9275]|uniref:Transcriptional regulatory protein YpdB n=1 Tax=Dyadobacter helix TaxID=2822344 RepID=A0A916J9V6_9BACT|nr:LytTR family DNA-binding domain-containing protein [Dyadobacter sp. CECT 9275]CAG4994071.1 Transcriptional regulatory protein YpdB [Dyadobacter sp. CECT 9275]